MVGVKEHFSACAGAPVPTAPPHSVKPGSLAAGSDPREHAAVDVDGDARHEVVSHAQHDRVRLLLRRARALDEILCSPTAV